MNLGKLLKFGKKGAKHMAPKKGDKAEGGFAWPPGLRVGIFGPSNSGKTVYLTILNEDCKYQRDLQIAASGATSAEFLSNLRKIRGVSQAVGEGTRVHVSDEKSFPDLTLIDKVLEFTAVVDQDEKVPVVSYDYPGDAVSIDKQHDLAEKVGDFMAGCDGLLFMFDPKKLLSDEWQSDAASFVNMIQRLGPLNSPLTIPVALVITKADTLPGFRGEEHVRLISSEDEPIASNSYEDFLIHLINHPRIAEDAQWQGTVREILEKLRDFFRVVLTRTLDFQVFFVSSTGEEPEKVGVDIGRSLYKPPDVIRPSGVREPFKWLLRAVLRRRHIERVKKLKSWVRLVSVVWVSVISILFGWHLWGHLSRATSLENQTLAQVAENDPARTSEQQRSDIRNAYRTYAGKWTVRKIFPKYRAPAVEIAERYSDLRDIKAKEKLSVYVQELADELASGSAPVTVGGDQSVKVSATVQQALREIGSFTADSGTAQAGQAARIETVWQEFQACFVANDTTAWRGLAGRLQQYRSAANPPTDQAEQQLYDAMAAEANRRLETRHAASLAEQAETRWGQIKSEISANAADPEYLIETATRALRNYLNRYGEVSPDEYKQAARKYIDQAGWWSSQRSFNCEVVNVPPGGHLHIYSVKDLESLAYDVPSQYGAGTTVDITWAPGYYIVVAFDKAHLDPREETFGEQAYKKVILDRKYSILDLAGFSEEVAGGTIQLILDTKVENKLPTLQE